MVYVRSEKPVCVLWSVPNVSSLKRFQCSSDWRWLYHRPFKEDRLALSLYTPFCSWRLIALCPKVVFPAPQHFRASEKQASCEVCFAPQSLLGHFRSLRHVQGSSPKGVFEGGCRPLTHSSLGFPFHFSFFCSKLIESVRMTACAIQLSPLEVFQRRAWVTASTCFHLHCQAGGWDRINCAVFMDGSRIFFVSEAPPWLVFGDWTISVRYEVLRFAVFLNEKLDLWLCFACWTFSTVLSRIFWPECLIETPEFVWVSFPLLGLLELCQLAYLQSH